MWGCAARGEVLQGGLKGGAAAYRLLPIENNVSHPGVKSVKRAGADSTAASGGFYHRYCVPTLIEASFLFAMEITPYPLRRNPF